MGHKITTREEHPNRPIHHEERDDVRRRTSKL